MVERSVEKKAVQLDDLSVESKDEKKVEWTVES